MLVFGYNYNCTQKPSFFHFIFKLEILCKKKIVNSQLYIHSSVPSVRLLHSILGGEVLG